MHRAGRHAVVVGAGTALQDKASQSHDCRLLAFGCVARSFRCSLRLPKVSARGVLHLGSCFAHRLLAERSRPRLLHARRLGSPTDAAHSVLEPMVGARTRFCVLSFGLQKVFLTLALAYRCCRVCKESVGAARQAAKQQAPQQGLRLRQEAQSLQVQPHPAPGVCGRASWPLALSVSLGPSSSWCRLCSASRNNLCLCP